MPDKPPVHQIAAVVDRNSREPGEGRIDQIEIATDALRRYDSRGNLVSRQDDVDFNSDGVVDTRVLSESAYDSRGRLVSSTSSVDSDADGTVDTVSTVTISYISLK